MVPRTRTFCAWTELNPSVINTASPKRSDHDLIVFSLLRVALHRATRWGEILNLSGRTPAGAAGSAIVRFGTDVRPLSNFSPLIYFFACALPGGSSSTCEAKRHRTRQSLDFSHQEGICDKSGAQGGPHVAVAHGDSLICSKFQEIGNFMLWLWHGRT
jgi:hypothetical protein